jgi:hypothetical protein
MRVPTEEFVHLPLEVHAFLKDVPLQDVSAVDLPGGGPDRTIADVRAILASENLHAVNGVVRMLVALRRAIGRPFGWDTPAQSIDAHLETSYARRVEAELARRSRVAVGTPASGMHVLYVLEHEALSEVRNATVHAFFAQALVRREGGYRLYLGVYVKPIARFTRLYMAAIEPFRRFVVYPAILRKLRARWIETYRRPA